MPAERVDVVEALAGTEAPAVRKVVRRVEFVAAYSATTGVVDPDLSASAGDFVSVETSVAIAI